VPVCVVAGTPCGFVGVKGSIFYSDRSRKEPGEISENSVKRRCGLCRWRGPALLRRSAVLVACALDCGTHSVLWHRSRPIDRYHAACMR
jgi:hypothetical protein